MYSGKKKKASNRRWSHHESSEVRRHLETGALSELPVRRFALENIAAAHEAVENHIVGKVVIDLSASEDSIEY
jgi:NADPH:quinone reductase-like Zn-dependent oxidoreductase